MINESSICNKYAELSIQYKDANVDDFESFVCARVADYFINAEHIPSTEVYTVIQSVLFNFLDHYNEPETAFETEEDPQNEAESAPTVRLDSLKNKKEQKPLWLNFAEIGAVGILCVCAVCLTIQKRKRRK